MKNIIRGGTYRRFPPLQPDHWAVGESCTVCKKPFESGDETALIPGLPASEEDAEKQRARRPYTAEAFLVHFNCTAR